MIDPVWMVLLAMVGTSAAATVAGILTLTKSNRILARSNETLAASSANLATGRLTAEALLARAKCDADTLLEAARVRAVEVLRLADADPSASPASSIRETASARLSAEALLARAALEAASVLETARRHALELAKPDLPAALQAQDAAALAENTAALAENTEALAENTEATKAEETRRIAGGEPG